MPVEIPRNLFKARLRSSACQVGFWSTLGSPVVSELLGLAGFDWIAFDTEHGPADPYTTLLQLQALAGTATSGCVRIASNDPVLAKKALDIGAQTLIVPQVDSAADARRAIASTLFPPAGTRGVSTTARAGRYGAIADYPHRADAEICVVIMIESAAALRALPEIIDVEGVDAILFGPQDLAADMGFLARPGTPDVVTAIEQAVAFILARGKSPGVAVGNEADAQRWIERGARFVTCGADVALLGRGTEAVAQRMARVARPD
ncbi:MAG: HpcH/HpaI aldolase/citrate lyase family protein [Betaproteobacteria bacterium]|nr:HpcH/HpaI aldolase/citrate lyase family protein [Betaproteobacteria bacterium]